MGERVAKGNVGVMKVGFLLWGNQEMEREWAAYAHRIHELRRWVEARGHETEVAYTEPFDGRGKSAWTADKRAIRAFLDRCNTVYLGHTDCAAYAAAARKNGKGLIYDSHTPLIGERLMMFKANKSPRNFYLYLRSMLHESLAARRCSVITTASLPAVDYYKDTFSRSKDDVFLVRNHFDPDKFPLLPMPDSNRIEFAYVGGMSRWQGVADLIEGYGKSNKRFGMTIVGFDEANDKNLLQMARAAGVNAQLRMPREQAVQFLASAHYGVTATPKVCAVHMPGAFPTKWAEYLGIGRSVMITGAYECASITDSERFGIVCESGPEGIKQGLEAAADISVQEIAERGKRGRDWVLSNCSIDVVGPAFMKAIERASAST